MKKFDYPYKPVRVTGKYRTLRRPNHNGTDYGRDKSKSGPWPIKAIADGVINSRIAGHARAGNYLQIDHGDGVKSGYSHMVKFASGMTAGKSVKRGQTIGHMGATGNVTGVHLHLAIWVDGDYVNPHKFVKARIAKQEVDDVTRSKGGKTTEDWLTRAQIKDVQAALRKVFPAYRWKVKYKRGRLITPDGFDGPQTQAWVEEFQRRVGIKVDGIIGPVTKGKLAEYGITI
jgi:peptidoglycan hydrolase-like protein with peptidoglycan-binding domain